MADQHTYTGRLPEGRCVRVRVAGARIAKVETVAADPSLPYLLPVLVDLQQNGALGTYFSVIEQTGPGAMPAIAAHLRRHGVGRCLLTLATYQIDGQARSLRVLDQYLSANADAAALFFGFFHEGIFISPVDGWRGAHVREWLQPPDYEAFLELDEAAGGRIRTVNVAPEEPGGLDFVARAAAAGKVVAIGHSCSPPEVTREAIARGATMVTHFGNGAAPQVHRFKNPFWAWLAAPQLALGLICDGVHLPPELLQVAFKCKTRAQCIPVSDASGYAGWPPGAYTGYGERQFVIEPSRKISLAGQDVMMGAWFQQDRCVETLVQALGMDLVEAWAQCSTVPAAFMGLDLPPLQPGAEASFVLARWDDGVVIEQSVHLGQAYPGPVRPADAAPAQ